MSPAIEHLAGFASGLAKGLISQCSKLTTTRLLGCGHLENLCERLLAYAVAQVERNLADPSPLVEETFKVRDVSGLFFALESTSYGPTFK